MLAALERSRDAERRFLADASHELRTPLTALRGNAAYLARHAPEGDAFADLEADIARLGRLVDSLLAVAREDAAAAPAERVDLADAGRAAGRRAGDRARGRAGAAACWATVAAIARALDNLVANARRYGPPGEHRHVRLARQRSGP